MNIPLPDFMIFVILLIVFAIIYRNILINNTWSNSFYYSVGSQTLTGASIENDENRPEIKIIVTIQSFIGFLLIIGFFTSGFTSFLHSKNLKMLKRIL